MSQTDISPRSISTAIQTFQASLAGSGLRNVGALGALLSTSDRVTRPSPVGASTLGAKNVDGGSAGRDGTLDILNSKTSDGNAGGRGSSGRSVLVVLLDDNTVLGDVLESDAVVCHAADRTGGLVDGLDADTVVGVLDGGVGDGDILDDVVGAATDRADTDAVATGAGALGEYDVGSAVDSEAVILVLHVGAGDGDARGASDIESIGVVTSVLDISSRVVNGDVSQGEILR